MDFQSIAPMASSAGGKNSNDTRIGVRPDSAFMAQDSSLMPQARPRPPPPRRRRPEAERPPGARARRRPRAGSAARTPGSHPRACGAAAPVDALRHARASPRATHSARTPRAVRPERAGPAPAGAFARTLPRPRSCRPAPPRRLLRGAPYRHRPPKARLRAVRGPLDPGRCGGARTGAVAKEYRIAPIELRQEPAHEACCLGLISDPVVDPLTLAHAHDEPALAQDLQVPRHA